MISFFIDSLILCNHRTIVHCSKNSKSNFLNKKNIEKITIKQKLCKITNFNSIKKITLSIISIMKQFQRYKKKRREGSGRTPLLTRYLYLFELHINNVFSFLQAFVCAKCQLLIPPSVQHPAPEHRDLHLIQQNVCIMCHRTSDLKLRIPYPLVYLMWELAVLGIRVKLSHKWFHRNTSVKKSNGHITDYGCMGFKLRQVLNSYVKNKNLSNMMHNK